MDQLTSFGTSIAQSVGPTIELYKKLLQSNEKAIKSTLRKSFAFGTNPRHNLDVYYPSSHPTGANCPVFMFVYGGGLSHGNRISPDGLLYANIGHFFAEKCGYVVVIPDYRLVPEARFPSGGEDIAMALEWLIANHAKLGSDEGVRSLFMMGNSAGAVHLSTFLLRQEFAHIHDKISGKGTGCPLRLKAAILCSMPAHFQNADPSRNQTINTYYETAVEQKCPLGLLKACKQENKINEVAFGAKVLVLTASLDPEDEILSPSEDFVTYWRSNRVDSASSLAVQTMDGHNHISPTSSLGTGYSAEEVWGFQVAKFCNTAARS
ncbi:hypothetical protein AU210_016568 [Fusarium oxysporum f. sp. radicis-cucumerinum]|uniref:BD-FAE-like domain-containing protein n=1 Tax=Fusarium oxysporum f. sp. radicis-cucumerinum TaxID=327505 RepID=A0A2H3G9Q8_FUSOX|nr:hypothetical protein AU210_016568 [Fusarium oxysporum f. sp. radicis-cucumerinum]